MVEVTGAGADTVPRDETHLVVRSMRAAFDVLGEQPPGLRLHCENVIPHARGLGSSSAAIVGGLALARALVSDGAERLDDDALFRLAADLEGHPDNVAPAALGGFVISGREADAWYAVSAPVDPRVVAVAFVPPDPVSTEVARGLLPADRPARRRRRRRRADRAAGRRAGRRARAPARRRPATTCTRTTGAPAMPASLDLVDRLRADGLAAVVSGAGPDRAGARPTPARSRPTTWRRYCPDGWEQHTLLVAAEGVRVACTSVIHSAARRSSA